MERSVSFADAMEAQEALVEIIRRRMADLGRKRIIAETKEAQRAFSEGRCRPTIPADLMSEIRS